MTFCLFFCVYVVQDDRSSVVSEGYDAMDIAILADMQNMLEIEFPANFNGNVDVS